MNLLPPHNSGKPPAPSKELRQLVDGLLADNLKRLEFARLEELLEEDPNARRYYLEVVGNETLLPQLLSEAGRGDAETKATSSLDRAHPMKRWVTGGAAAAAAVVIAATVWSLQNRSGPTPSADSVVVKRDGSSAQGPSQSPAVIAHLESESQAVWAGSHPEAVGAPMTAGSFELTSGMAELRFSSGVLVAVEGPARLEIIDPMRCHLHWGTSVLDVPPSGEGFVVETPFGHAVDHGTRFAVIVEKDADASEFEVLKGKISVFHGENGEMLPLTEAEAARVTKTSINGMDSLPSRSAKLQNLPNVVRIRTEGQEACVLRRTQAPTENLLNPDLLMVKRDLPDHPGALVSPSDRRSLINFGMEGVDTEKVEDVRLLLNLVPSGLGFASLLPEVSTFEVYGIRDDLALESWVPQDLTWDRAPGSHAWTEGINDSEVRLLGSFDIPRGTTHQSIHFESPELLKFVREDSTGEVGFLLVRATGPIEFGSLVHAFAASTHPSSSGPSLEVRVSGEGSSSD